VAADVQAAIT
jgi:hypothetical protein